MYYVYLISDHTRTYIGYTSDYTRRLQQHNGILKGGAKSTRGRQWHFVTIIGGFNTIGRAMQAEYRWKRARGIINRLQLIDDILASFAESHIVDASCHL